MVTCDDPHVSIWKGGDHVAYLNKRRCLGQVSGEISLGPVNGVAEVRQKTPSP